jgi:K+-transporting ATPase KdpF subunit
MDALLSNWDYALWGLIALGLLIYLAYALVQAEKF